SSASASRRRSRPAPPSATPSSTPSASGCRTPRSRRNESSPPWPDPTVETTNEELHLLPARDRRAGGIPPGEHLGQYRTPRRRDRPARPTERVRGPAHPRRQPQRRQRLRGGTGGGR